MKEDYRSCAMLTTIRMMYVQSHISLAVKACLDGVIIVITITLLPYYLTTTTFFSLWPALPLSHPK